MSIKKNKLSKLSKKNINKKKYKFSKKSKLSKNSRNKKNSKLKKSRILKNSKISRQKFRKYQRGGFGSSCNLATVKEPGFKLDALNGIAGLSLPESSAVIFRPNCRSKSSSSQAMAP